MEKYKSILMRFLKGAIAGAVASMGLVSITQPSVWADWTILLNNLALAGSYGALTGLLLAIQKFVSWEE